MPPEPTPAEIARGWQGPTQPRYPKQDLMADTVIPQGTKIYSLQYSDKNGNLVGGDYFFTEDEFERYLAEVKEGRPDAYRRLNERLQIAPKLDYDNNLYQYKPHIVEHEVKYPFRASQGLSTENKQFGAGEGEQVFIHKARRLEELGVFEKTGQVVTAKPNEVVALNTSDLKKFLKKANKIKPLPSPLPKGRFLQDNEYRVLSAEEVANIKTITNNLHVTEGTRLRPGTDPDLVEYGPTQHFPETLAKQPPELLEKAKVGTLRVDKTRTEIPSILAAQANNSIKNPINQAAFSVPSSLDNIDLQAAAATTSPNVVQSDESIRIKTQSKISLESTAAIAANRGNNISTLIDQAAFSNIDQQAAMSSSGLSTAAQVNTETTSHKTQESHISSNKVHEGTNPGSDVTNKNNTIANRTSQAAHAGVLAAQVLTGDTEGAVNGAADIAKQKALQTGVKTLSEKLTDVAEKKITKRLAGKIPLGVGVAVSAYQVEQAYEEVARLEGELAKLTPETPEYNKMEVMLSRAERSADFAAASAVAGVVPGEGTIVSAGIDVLDAALTTKDIISDYSAEVDEKLAKLTPGSPEYHEVVKQYREQRDELFEKAAEATQSPIPGAGVVSMAITEVGLLVKAKDAISDYFSEDEPIKEINKEKLNEDRFTKVADKREANVEKVFQEILEKSESSDSERQKEEEEKQRKRGLKI